MMAAMLMSCAGNKKNDDTANSSSKEVAVAEVPEQERMLLGLQERKALEAAPYNSWYESNYEEYELDEELLEKIAPLTDNLEIVVFMGTWCSDSQHQVPAFYKILDALDFPEEKVTLITMDRKKATPENLEEGLEILNVPTMIFKKEGKEINRIVEFPIESLEDDMYQILSGKEYKHAYAW